MTQTVDLRDLFSHHLTLKQREHALRWVLSSLIPAPIRGGRSANYADYEERLRAFDLVADCVHDFESALLQPLVENTSGSTALLSEYMDTHKEAADTISAWLENKTDVSGVFGP